MTRYDDGREAGSGGADSADSADSAESADDLLDEELRFHLDMEAERLERAGVAPAEARRRARLAFGGYDRIREEVGDARGVLWLEHLRRDTRFALRGLRRNPGFALAAVLTLALGIGANTAIFGAVHGVLLRPLAYPEADRLAVVWLSSEPEGMERDVFAYPILLDIREQASTLAGVAAYAGAAATLSEGDAVERVEGAAVTADFFPVLGTAPALGRSFGAAETEAGIGDVVVLSHGLWTRRYGADAAIVGQRIRMGTGTAEVLGVMPRGFGYPDGAEFWRPLVRTESNASLFDGRGVYWARTIARLAPGASYPQANVELGAIMDRLAVEYPETQQGLGAWAEPLHDTIVGDVRPALLVLLGAVGFVLLIACANVANLMLARGAARQKELAVRTALGASGGRLARQALTESLVLAAAGGAAGVLLAWAGTAALIAASPPGLPRVDGISLDATVLGFAAAVALLTGLIFGLAPALQARGAAVAGVLREGGRGGAGDRLARMRPALITLEVALALVLLVGAGLLVRSFAALQSVDPGFRTENVLSFRLTIPAATYPSGEQVRAFRGELAARLEALPDVEAVRGISTLFLDPLPNMAPITVAGRVASGDGPQSSVTYDNVDPGFFGALGVPIIRGRDFNTDDVAGAPPAVIVNQTLVRRYFPAEDPIGQRFTWGNPENPDATWYTVVGVVADMRRTGLAEAVRAEAFRSTAQLSASSLEYLVTTRRDAIALVPEVRALMRDLDPALPIFDVRTVEQALANAVATRRFIMLLLAGFAAIAVLLAAVGIYGVLAYLVGQRTRELGVRMALGAERRDVLALVLRDSMRHVLPGLVLGLAGALLLTRLLAAQLFGISATDPLTFGAVTALLLAVGLLASSVPAWRAASVEPNVTLRAE